MPTGDDALAADPYDWQATKAGHVLVFRGGRRVDTVGGKEAARLLARLEQADDAGDDARVQHLLAARPATTGTATSADHSSDRRHRPVSNR